MSAFAIAIHGGAGTIRRSEITPEREALLREGLGRALEAGAETLAQGGSALDAVTASVCSLEDNPLFNAGRGAVFNAQGHVELEASIMDGRNRAAGSVTGVRRARNPVLLARTVMERTEHVTLGFSAADDFARAMGLPLADQSYFFTQMRWDALQTELARISSGKDANNVPDNVKHGTVGAVAIDTQGHLAAATSTGGRTAKMAGRIGDTPIIGGGNWADEFAAISCTGHGESFVRCAAAHDVAARIRYGGMTLDQAADGVVHTELIKLNGSGGLIAIDRYGNIAMPFNCEGMYRAALDTRGKRRIAIYQE